eukprot:343760-Pleurochrysis_carterae.AAC.1
MEASRLHLSNLAKQSATSAPGAVPRHMPAPNPILCPEETDARRGRQKRLNSMHIGHTDWYSN